MLTLLFPFMASGESLPEPLSLEAALETSHNPLHFDLVEIDQHLRAARAEMGIQQGDNGFSLDLVGRIREVGLSDAADDDDESNDSAASLILSKPLYDFGLQNSRETQLELQLQALEQQKRLVIEQRRLRIMEQYFAVLNADNDFISENEALAIGFIRYDNAVQDQELGLVAAIEVVRLQSEYEVIRQKRYLAEHQQRLTRAILAESMGYPGQLPSDLDIPQIDTRRKLSGDIEALVAQALQRSQEARVVSANTQAARAAIGIAEATDNPSLELEFQVSSYERESRLRDDWRASLYFQIPLYSSSPGNNVDLAKARYRQAIADQQQLQSHLRLEVLGLWQKIQQLGFKIQGKIVEQDYRDRYLDRSRAEYELEFKTDLGDSMVLYSRSNTERLRALYAFELAYQRLVSLVGIDFLDQFSSTQ
ncbi:MAG: TolC family protein [Gammaproteobacteria bacterium]|nr:TolC family protein [Gammaproteobacteria bacterium]